MKPASFSEIKSVFERNQHAIPKAFGSIRPLNNNFVRMINFSRSLFFLLLLTAIFSGCKKDSSGISSSFYFSANIDGQKILYEDKKNGYGSGIGVSGLTVPAGYEEEQSFFLSKGIATNSTAGVIIAKTFADYPIPCDQIQAMFVTGNYSYGKLSKDTNHNGINGVVIYYVDGNGKEWTSDNGVGTQTNSNFEIVEHIDNTDGFSLKITKAKFNCTLYDDAGNSIELTNGEIRGRSVFCGYK